MYQKVKMIGYLGRDPEQRFMPSGKPVTRFSVATNYVYKDGDGKKIETTTWFNISTYGGLGDVCFKYLKKRKQVYIEGRLVPDKSTGGPRVWKREDGTPAASYDVTAQKVLFLGKKDPFEAGEDLEDDEIPF